MKAAVTYDNGNVFPHFGRTEFFKIYNIEAMQVVSSEVISCGGVGHEALAQLLNDRGVDTLICGGMGSGAKAALDQAGILVCSGASGNCDEALQAYLRGELISEDINCDHHDHEHEGEHEECCSGGCGDGCCEGGTSCGGCHSEMQVIMDGKNAGKKCRVHYTGTFNDGTKFDSSYDHGQPLEFVCGVGMMIKGFDEAVVNMEVGESRDIHLMPADAYGEYDPSAVVDVAITDLPGSEGLSVGDKVTLAMADGRRFPVTVAKKDAERIWLDANPEMAGKELNFHIELLSAE